MSGTPERLDDERERLARELAMLHHVMVGATIGAASPDDPSAFPFHITKRNAMVVGRAVELLRAAPPPQQTEPAAWVVEHNFGIACDKWVPVACFFDQEEANADAYADDRIGNIHALPARVAPLYRAAHPPVPDPVHDEAADAPSGPLEWRRIADNVFRLSRWLDSIGRAGWGHELRRASGELSRAHDLAQPSQMDVDALEDRLGEMECALEGLAAHAPEAPEANDARNALAELRRHLFGGAPQDVESAEK